MHKQTIYYGAPGTGKSYAVDEMIASRPGNPQAIRVTVHPEFTYMDFVGQLLPSKNTKDGSYFEFAPGPFTVALKAAYADLNREVYLVLEELSRGNVAAIFGDVFQLLDRDEYFKSRYPIYNSNIASVIPSLNDDEVGIPSNLNIIGTVNVNDQNVFAMDTAFKRRFDWEYVSSRPVENADGTINKKLNNPKVLIDGEGGKIVETTWQAFYVALNKYIVDKKLGMGRSEDRQIGQFFLSFSDKLVEQSHSEDEGKAKRAQSVIESAIKNKLLLYLWEDVQGSSSFGQSKSLFDSNVTSYDELYFGYGHGQVFNSEFINAFLIPHKDAYPYASGE